MWLQVRQAIGNVEKFGIMKRNERKKSLLTYQKDMNGSNYEYKVVSSMKKKGFKWLWKAQMEKQRNKTS